MNAEPNVGNLLKNSFLLFSSSGAVGAIQIVTISVFLTQFGIEAYGLFVLLRLFLPSGLLLFFDFGLNESATRFISYNFKNKEVQRQSISLILFIFILISLFLSFLIYSNIQNLSNFFSLNNLESKNLFSEGLWLISLMIPIFYLGSLSESILRGKESFFIIKICEMLQALIFLFFIFISQNFELSIRSIIIFFILLVSLRYFFIFLFVLTKNRDLFAFKFPTQKLSTEVFSFSRNIILGKMLSLITNNIGLIWVGTIDVSFAGIYEAIMRIPKFFKSLIAQFNSSLVPYTAKMLSLKKQDDLSNTINMILSMQFYFWTPLISSIAWFGSDLVLIWLGKEYIQYGIFFSLAFIVNLFYCSSSAIASAALAEKSTVKIINIIGILEILLNIILLYLLSPMGINGFFLAFIFSVAVKHILFLFFFKNNLKYSFAFLRPFTIMSLISLILLFLESLTLNFSEVLYIVLFIILFNILSWWISFKYLFLEKENEFFRSLFMFKL